MNIRMWVGILLGVFGFITAGCVHDVRHNVDSSANLSAIKKVHVVINPSEKDWETPPFLKFEAESRGMVATIGYAEDAPKDADALLIVREKWAWDMTTYLANAELRVKDARTGNLLAAASAQSSSLGRKSAKEIATEEMTAIFGRPNVAK